MYYSTVLNKDNFKLLNNLLGYQLNFVIATDRSVNTRFVAGDVLNDQVFILTKIEKRPNQLLFCVRYELRPLEKRLTSLLAEEPGSNRTKLDFDNDFLISNLNFHGSFENQDEDGKTIVTTEINNNIREWLSVELRKFEVDQKDVAKYIPMGFKSEKLHRPTMSSSSEEVDQPKVLFGKTCTNCYVVCHNSVDHKSWEPKLFSIVSKIDIISLAFATERRKIVQLCCGRAHVVLLDNYGLVYSFGVGSRGELGHGSLEQEVMPRLLEALAGLQVKEISVGGWHSCALTRFGAAYVWGWNESGQLGLDKDLVPRAEVPVLIDMQSADSDFHLSTLDADSRCGNNDEPCTSASDESRTDLSSLPASDEERVILIKQVSCGSRHTAFLCENGALFCCGSNEYGQLGLGHCETVKGIVKVTEIDCGKVNVTSVQCQRWQTMAFM